MPIERPNYDRQRAETAFDQAKTLAGEFVAKDLSAKAALYAALEALFDLVRVIPDRVLIQEFVESKGGKWGQVARQNEFQPMVKLVFSGDGIGEASRSQYAKVLKYAQIVYSGREPPPVGLADWLTENGGIEGVYQKALLHVGGTRTLRTVPSENRLEEAKRRLAAERRSAAFELADDPGIEEGFVTALIRVGEEGCAYVVRLLETDQAKIETVLTGLVGEDAARATLRAKPLYPLFHVLAAVRALTPAASDDRGRMVVLDTIGDGTAKVVRLRSVNQEYQYTTVEGRLPHSMLPIADGVFEIQQPGIDRFVRWFGTEGEWSFDGDEPQALTFSGDDVAPIHLVAFDPTSKPLSWLSPSARRAVPFEMADDAVSGFVRWYEQHKSEWSQRTANLAQRRIWNPCLSLTWADGIVSISPYRTRGISLQLFSTRVDPAFGSDRFIDGTEFGPICELLEELERETVGWIIDSDEERAALAFDLSEGHAELTITMPLVKNLARDRASVCELISG